jgi:hypothetical protein
MRRGKSARRVFVCVGNFAAGPLGKAWLRIGRKLTGSAWTRTTGFAANAAGHDANEDQQKDYSEDAQPPWPMRCRLGLRRQRENQRNGGRARWNMYGEGVRIHESRCRQCRGARDVTRLQARASRLGLGDAHAENQQQQGSVFEVWAHHSGRLDQEFQPKVESGSNSVSMTN